MPPHFRKSGWRLLAAEAVESAHAAISVSCHIGIAVAKLRFTARLLRASRPSWPFVQLTYADDCGSLYLVTAKVKLSLRMKISHIQITQNLPRKAYLPQAQARRVPLHRRSPGRHQPLRQRGQPNPEAIPMDQEPRRDHRRRKARAPSVRFAPLAVRYERREDIHMPFAALGCALVCLNQIRRFCWAFLDRVFLGVHGLAHRWCELVVDSH